MTTSRVLSYKAAATEALLQAMEEDDRVFLMGEGVDHITGVYGHSLPAYERFGAARVIDTPLSENGLTGFCVGAALDGMRPILIHQRNDFMLLTMDQMMNQAAKLCYASNGKHKVPLVVLSFVARKPGEGVQHSQSLQAIFAHFPGIKVGMPATAHDAKGMLWTALQDDEPCIVLEHRALFEEEGPVPQELYTLPFSARVVRQGADVTLVGCSAVMTELALVAEALATEGVDCEVIDLRWIRPLDVATLESSVRKTGRLVVVDTGWSMYGMAAEVIASMSERALSAFKASPQRVTLPDVPCPAATSLEAVYHPDAASIIKVVRAVFE